MKVAIGKIPTESITLHRKGHWFKSSIAHHGNLPQLDHENSTSHNNPELALIRLLLEQLLGREGRRIMALKDKPNSEQS